MTLPTSPTLSTKPLSQAFKNTTATYKFFWLISLLQIHAKTNNLRIPVPDIITRMIANAWYPIHYFKLSFGKSDSLFSIVMDLHTEINIPIDANIEQVISTLTKNKDNQKVRSAVRLLSNNVPYRFLMPWISTPNNKEMVQRSQFLENNCLYALYQNDADFYIEINNKWDNYLHDNYHILTDFAYWNLAQFLQSKNPNVPAIPNKLIRPETRNSLSAQHRFWDTVIEIGGPINCIYTNIPLLKGAYDLDHFIPWSFVSHDLNWNLIPASGSINSSKSDKLPPLDTYLYKLASTQHHALSIFLNAGKNSKILEDYLSLGYTPQELITMPIDNFVEVYGKTMRPITQIAQNMGFEIWTQKI